MTERLPRGRHGLSRDEVVSAQRRRIVRAMAEAMVEHGYVKTSVADVIKRAGVSRETFYEQFSSKEDCYLAAFDAAVELMISHVSAGGDGAPLARFSRLFRLYLDTLIAEPAFARVYLLEVYAVGPQAMQRRAANQRRFVQVLIDIFGPDEEFALEMLVAGISSMVTTKLAALDLDGIDALHGPVVDLVRRTIVH